MLRRFELDRGEIWQDCSLYASIDGDGFVICMTSYFQDCAVRRSLLPAIPLSAYDIIGSLYALQFLIHRCSGTCSFNWPIFFQRY